MRPHLKKSKTTTIKKIRTKWIRGETQAVECLLYECEALSSKPESHKKKKRMS
jgi:hypothetical protein